MCASSVVSDYYMNTYPNRYPDRMNPLPYGGVPPPLVHTFDAETKDLLRQTLKLLDRLDKKLGDVECLDATKAAFLKSLDLDPSNLGG